MATRSREPFRRPWASGASRAASPALASARRGGLTGAISRAARGWGGGGRRAPGGRSGRGRGAGRPGGPRGHQEASPGPLPPFIFVPRGRPQPRATGSAGPRGRPGSHRLLRKPRPGLALTPGRLRCPPGSGRPGPTSQSPFEIRTGAGRGVAPFVPTQVVRPSGWPETPRWVAQGAALLPRSPGRRWGKPGKTEGGPPDPPRRGAPGEASDLQPFPGRVRAGRAFGNADEPPPGPGLNRLTQPPPAARAAGGGAMSGGLPFSPGAPVHCAFGRSHLSSPHALIRPPPSSPPGSGPEKGRQPGTPRMDNFSFCRRQGQA